MLPTTMSIRWLVQIPSWCINIGWGNSQVNTHPRNSRIAYERTEPFGVRCNDHMLLNIVVKQQIARQWQQMLYSVVFAKKEKQREKMKLEQNCESTSCAQLISLCVSTTNAVRFIYCIWRRIRVDVIWTITRPTPERNYEFTRYIYSTGCGMDCERVFP